MVGSSESLFSKGSGLFLLFVGSNGVAEGRT
jgi:hypothetical protein